MSDQLLYIYIYYFLFFFIKMKSCNATEYMHVLDICMYAYVRACVYVHARIYIHAWTCDLRSHQKIFFCIKSIKEAGYKIRILQDGLWK